MAPLRSLLTFAVICGALAALPAHARFGKSGGGSSDGGGSSSGSNSHSSSGSSNSSGGKVHAASPYGSTAGRGASAGGNYAAGAYQGRSGYSGGWGNRPYARSYWGTGSRSCWNSWWGCGSAGWGYAPLFYSAPVMTGPASVVSQPEPAPGGDERPVFTFSAQGQSFLNTGGGSLGGTAGYEQGRFGLMTEYNALFVPANDGSGGTDHLRLWNSYATFSILANERGRLRLGAGVDAAFAPEATFVGPGFIAQASVGVMGPIGLEGSVHVTPLPFTQVDRSAGVTVAVGPVGLRGGWRRIYLNDQGQLDGVSHEDVFAGPYVAVGIAL